MSFMEMKQVVYAVGGQGVVCVNGAPRTVWSCVPEQRDAVSQNSTYYVTKAILVFYID